ncbi:unnamed protein product [Cuscuta epithymum]|nr:unnamed protein product [Cuscuta epithymum]
MEYLFTFWTCLLLYKEYETVTSMRSKFLASRDGDIEEANGRLTNHPEQFTVLVRNIPRDSSDKSVSKTVGNYFKENYPHEYLCHHVVYDVKSIVKLVKKRHSFGNMMDRYSKKGNDTLSRRSGFLGLFGKQQTYLEYYQDQTEKLDKKLKKKREKILEGPEYMHATAFVTFKTRWGAAVCAQTQIDQNPLLWLTSRAPEPRDIEWKNLSISPLSITFRRIFIAILLFALISFYMIPIAFVQSLANLEGLEKAAPFLRPLIEWKVIKSFLQGFVPGVALKIFMLILPDILLVMSKIEGHVALSAIEREAAEKYYYFILINVFLGNIVLGTAFQQLHAFLSQSASQIPRNVGVSIPMKATFFITYIMVDGWAVVAAEILRLKALVMYHLKNMFAKTKRDRDNAMYPGGVEFHKTLSTLQLYFLLGSVYAVVTPILLPFIIVFFILAYFVFRHQVINVYHQEYESAAAFWPDVHGRIVASLIISQLLLMGLLSTKKAAKSTPLLLLLPFFTFAFHKYCKSRFEPAFKKYPLKEAMAKDRSNGEADLKKYQDKYLNPVLLPF